MLRKRLIVWLLLGAMLSAVLSARATAPETEPLWSRTTELTESLTLTEQVFLLEERQAERYICYTPGGSIRPMVYSGGALSRRQTFPDAAAQVEAEGKRVVAGVNGDYYVVATSIPLGLVVEDGRLLSSDDANWAFGFLPDGSAFLGRPALKMRLTIDGETYPLAALNKSAKKGGFYLYTEDFGNQTGCSRATQNVVLRLQDETELRIGETVSLCVESNYQTPGAETIPRDRLLLCLTTDSDSWRRNALAALKPGDQLSLSISAEDPRWEQCIYASGSLYKLLTEGQAEPGLDEIDKTHAPRTAVGLRADGTVVFYTVDGRQSGYSEGLTLAQVAQRLLELGCVEAGAMDGGGSTVLRAQYAGDETCSLLNRPSLGEERRVSTFLLLTAGTDGSGVGKTLSVRAKDPVLLTGSSTQLYAGACDETGAPVSLESLQWSTTDGEVLDDGTYLAPDDSCTAEIRLRAAGLTDTLELQVIDTPEDLRILHEATGREVSSLTLVPGEETELSARALWHSMPVTAGDAQFRWSVEGNIGLVDESGHFVASAAGGAGFLVLSAGERSLRIPVSVKTAVMCVADYEAPESGSCAGFQWEPETGRDHVRCGRGSLRLNYDLSAGSADFPLPLEWGGISRYATLWIYSNGSGLRVLAVQEEGVQELGALEHIGWQQFVIDTGGHGGACALRLEGGGSGTLWLDQLLLTDHAQPDLTPPVLQLSADGPLLTGTVRDDMDGCPDPEQLTLMLDGVPLAFDYESVTGGITALAEDNGRCRRAVLTGRDLSGNVHSVSVVLPGATSLSFPDLEQHWSREDVNYLASLGVIHGRAMEDGSVCFDPDSPVSRMEFAVMLCRWLKLDPVSASEEPAFADEAALPDWALDSVRTAAAYGLIQGERTSEGTVFRPRDPMTRAQAATVLGRTLEAGRMGADLAFADAEDTPDWALGYVSELGFLGVLRGDQNGLLHPNDPLTRAQAAKLLGMLTGIAQVG